MIATGIPYYYSLGESEILPSPTCLLLCHGQCFQRSQEVGGHVGCGMWCVCDYFCLSGGKG